MHFLTGLSALIWGLTSLYIAFKVVRSIRVVPNRTELLVERLGRYSRTLGPGVHFLIPFLDKVAFSVDLKEEAIEVPPQDCFTKDNVRVEVDGVLYMRVNSSKMASYGIVEFRFAIIQLAQTMVRSVIGTLDLDHTFEERDIINSRVVAALNDIGRTWGVQVSRYEVKNIVPPTTVREAMERQMGSERDRRALMARAEGEKQARINDADGKKQEMINKSQGEMQRRINEAEGKAEEILALAKATADSIRVVAETVSQPGGKEAVNLRLSQQLITKMGALSAGQKVLLPADLTKVGDLISGIGLDLEHHASVPKPAPQPVPAPARETVAVRKAE
jgi:regulator of protease activity HflC (stomatin/prohibitin superfamily)